MEKVPQEVLNCLEANKRYITQKLEYLDDLLEEINYEENAKIWNEDKLRQMKEEYERELRDLVDRKKIYEDMVEQTEKYIGR